jgi:hypothetical protein
MTELKDIPKKIGETRALLLEIQDGHMGADVRHERVRNEIAFIDLELKVHQINSMETLSRTLVGGIRVFGSSAEAQEKQTKSLTLWTKVMAVAIVVQSLVLSVQVFLALQKVFD